MMTRNYWLVFGLGLAGTAGCILGLFTYLHTIAPERAAIITDDFFSLRERFLAGAKAAGARLESFPIDARGPAGQQLGWDVAWIGSPEPQRVLLHISGTHGVEGYAGSAIQSAILERGVKVPEGTAIIFVHGLNSWGMAHKRRFNESNVDLNRNFLLSPAAFTGAPEAYRALNTFLNPDGAPVRLSPIYLKAAINVLVHGFNTLKQAIAGGQYEFPKGIYYGGAKLEQSLVQFRDFVSSRLAGAKELYVIEVHTGLGTWAKDVLFWPLPPSNEKSQRFSKLLGEELASDAPDEGVGFRTPGDLQNEVPPLLPNTDTYWLLQEFGAYGPVRTMRALRDENHYHQSGGTDLNHWSKKMLVESFSPGDSGWQSQVVARGVELFNKMQPLLARS